MIVASERMKYVSELRLKKQLGDMFIGLTKSRKLILSREAFVNGDSWQRRADNITKFSKRLRITPIQYGERVAAILTTDKALAENAERFYCNALCGEAIYSRVRVWLFSAPAFKEKDPIALTVESLKELQRSKSDIPLHDLLLLRRNNISPWVLLSLRSIMEYWKENAESKSFQIINRIKYSDASAYYMSVWRTIESKHTDLYLWWREYVKREHELFVDVR